MKWSIAGWDVIYYYGSGGTQKGVRLLNKY